MIIHKNNETWQYTLNQYVHTGKDVLCIYCYVTNNWFVLGKLHTNVTSN